MRSGRTKMVLALVLGGALLALGGGIAHRLGIRNDANRSAAVRLPVPVEVAAVASGPISHQRTFSGELESRAAFVVAPKVSGRVERMRVNIADPVTRGQVVAELDNAEYVQAVAQAQADLAVARANLAEAGSALETADRESRRTEKLLSRGIASDSEFDAARQAHVACQAQRNVAAAQVLKAESALETANIRLGYTIVTAGWTGGDDRRVVADRYVDEGQTVAANAPLLLIVELHPIVGIIHVTERDYAFLASGQTVSLTTDAYPGETFTGRIDRIAPVFERSTRQARVEMLIDNPDQRLKPGMFISATVDLATAPMATIVPEQALTVRNDQAGVFMVSDDGRTVQWRPVSAGIRQGGRVQVTGAALSGRVVTLGQQLISDGAAIIIPGAPAAPAGERDTPR